MTPPQEADPAARLRDAERDLDDALAHWARPRSGAAGAGRAVSDPVGAAPATPAAPAAPVPFGPVDPLDVVLAEPAPSAPTAPVASTTPHDAGPEPTPEPTPTPAPAPDPDPGPAAATGTAPQPPERALDEALALVTRNPDGGGHRASAWHRAREFAVRAGHAGGGGVHLVPAAEALGEVLAGPLTALTDLPPFDTSAMDGWAVSGPAPWTVRTGAGVLAGSEGPEPLADGEAVRIATGARVPPSATAVVRSEHARLDAEKERLYPERLVHTGQDIRPRGQECRTGDLLLPEGARVSPAVLGLAAAAGYDELRTHPRPRVEVLVLGDELLTSGLPHEGLIRDALGPMLAPWLRSLGAEVLGTHRIGDDPEGADTLHELLAGSAADLVLTTGGTASGPVDHVHPVLRRLGAELLVDGVAVRPGHPMLLARLPAPVDEPRRVRHLVGLPGNPLAAVSGLVTLAEPLLRALSGRAVRHRWTAAVRDAVPGHPHDTRLIPVLLDGELCVPLRWNGPAMLRGVAGADALAVVPPHGAEAGQELEILDLPWSSGGCFT
ncbi:molybdopterin molybdotransferase MoeA [Streptomyces sp. BI20]|uniref:molybdopterin molybdotransferase MoeA n=1 Tax=Streptomyces sp. BI20 TaxID=3403460 RepID=UPI003C7659F1